MIDPKLSGRVVLITGANNPCGIGAATARAFVDQGAHVVVHGYRHAWKGGHKPDLSDRADIDVEAPGEVFYNAQGRKPVTEVVDSITKKGGQASGLECDLSEPDAAISLFDKAEQEFGPVEVLVNNAGYWEGDTFIPENQDLVNKKVEMWTKRPTQINAGVFDRVVAVNTRAPALLIAEFASRHVKRAANWGRIINIGTAGAYCFPSEVTYGASKLALEGYTRSAAKELARFGITVNAISPGPVQTGWITSELESDILPSIPLGRIGTPEDIADVIVFLASDQARWMTGQKFFVGGGHGM